MMEKIKGWKLNKKVRALKNKFGVKDQNVIMVFGPGTITSKEELEK